MEHSESLSELAGALAKAQAVMKPALKDSENPFFRSKYADLAAVAEACREALATNQLSVVQGTQKGESADVIHLDTMLLHSSGQWVRSTLTMVPTKKDPQGVGSCITYARRYALSAICGIATEEDDDGNAASGKQSKERQKPSASAPPPGQGVGPDGEDTTTGEILEHAAKNREQAAQWIRPIPRPAHIQEHCPTCQAPTLGYRSTSKKFLGRVYFQCEAAYALKQELLKQGVPNARANAQVDGHYREWADEKPEAGGEPETAA